MQYDIVGMKAIMETGYMTYQLIFASSWPGYSVPERLAAGVSRKESSQHRPPRSVLAVWWGGGVADLVC